ncbi:MAG: TIGR00269 family protein [Methanomicrobiales archaeon]|nr:TIGR00269 family protein [Methanomicrobiales archaeon]
MAADQASNALPPSCEFCSQSGVFLDRVRNRHLCGNHFVDDVEERVRGSIQEYALVQPGDRLAVALSGGKDSTVLLHLLRRLMPGADLVAVTVDEGIDGYREATLRSAEANTRRLGIEHAILSFRDLYGKTLDELARGQEHRACGICGILRRKAMNTLARQVGAGKLATGHNLDDESQSILMNWLRGDRERVLRRPEENGGQGFIPRMKPLMEIPEREVALYGILKGLFVELPECPYRHTALRGEVRGILTSLERGHPGTMRRVVEGQARLSRQLAPIPRASRPLQACELCGDPTSGRICQACRFLHEEEGSPFGVNRDL